MNNLRRLGIAYLCIGQHKNDPRYQRLCRRVDTVKHQTVALAAHTDRNYSHFGRPRYHLLDSIT